MLARSAVLAGVCALFVGGVVALTLALAPITGHFGDGEQDCGNLIHHAQATDAIPPTVATAEHPATLGNPGTTHFDACPGASYHARANILRVATPIAFLTAGALALYRSARRAAGAR